MRALAVARGTGEAFAAVNVPDSEGNAVGSGVYRLGRGGERWTRLAAGLPRRLDGKLAELRSLAAHPRTGAVCVGTNGFRVSGRTLGRLLASP